MGCDSVSYELVGFTVVHMQPGDILHQSDVYDRIGWFVFPKGYHGFDGVVKPLTLEEVLESKTFLYGAFDRLYRLEQDVYEISVSFVGNTFSHDRGGIEAEMTNMGREVFDDWEDQIVGIAKRRLDGLVRSKNYAERFNPVSFVTLWAYEAGVYWSYSEPDDYWSEWRLLGEVGQGTIDALARSMITEKQKGDE